MPTRPAGRIAGFNITIPHKQTIMPYLDEIDSAAREIGAVNTVVCRDGRLHGYNTDAQGFLDALQRDGVSPRGRSVVVLGAGGAARGVCFALLKGGATQVCICNRTLQSAQALCRDFAHLGRLTAQTPDAPLPRTSLLVNATSVGMHPAPDQSPVENLSFVEAGGYVCDIIYNPFQTKLLRQAAEAGLPCQNGLYMLIYQAVAAYRLFTGAVVPDDVAEQVYSRLRARYHQ